ncbi:cache domain-containing sensor histidine kinase [Paenibacillus thalictri]|uniref:histidine kinase n=1 Tax=Paenibacillus thalictri TaxID=2527873 RepID=A0A4V2J336_9BACL|nr:histidine kinase [Paenibacillus thalictri]TBL69378.1 sensor histidine kinase [Paenibacillus thalictri]
MLKMMENIKLKSQLLLLICLSIGIIILLQIIYFSWFESINTRNYSQFLKDNLKQLEMKAVTYSKDINNIINITSFNELTFQFVNSQDIDDRLRLKNNMQVMIDSILLSNKSINGIIISDLDMINIGAYKREDFWVLNEVAKLYREGSIPRNQPTHYIFEGHESGKPFYVCVNKSFSSYQSGKDFITVVVYNADSFVSTVSGIKPNDNSLFLIADSHDNVIASNRAGLGPADVQQINDGFVQGKEQPSIAAFIGGKKPLAYEIPVETLNWRIIGITPDVEVTKDLSELKRFGALMGGIVILVLLGFGYTINKSMTAPITHMAHFMNSLGSNYSTRRFAIYSRNEISLLARTMNKMLDNIDTMTSEVVASQEKLYQAEIAKKQAQFAAFQSQVNPHFLYNTLDCIRSIALAREVPEIFEITTSMAKIFRYSIKENTDVKVGDELECIQDYFSIIQIRQSNRFALVCEVEPQVMNCLIPKMILQPIVENAVFHGLEQKKGPGVLTVRGYDSGGKLMFEIEDDGKGMPAETLSRLAASFAAWDVSEGQPVGRGSNGIGLINIDRRIKLLYGGKFGVTVNSSRDEGTKVVIVLPAIT